MKENYRYFIFNKPFNVLSQFTSEIGKKSLADFIDLPKNIYPVGRLDYDSEGLLILTNDNFLKNELLSPEKSHKKVYLAQVEGVPTTKDLFKFQSGLEINVNGKTYKTREAFAELLINFTYPERNIPIRFRKNLPTSWLKITIYEGKNRQIRKMTAKIGYPTLRLIRIGIEEIKIENLEPGKLIELSKNSIYKKLKITN